MARIKISPLPYIGDVFKNDYDNPVRARRRLHAYKMTYKRMLIQAPQQERPRIKMALRKFDKAIKLVGGK